MKTYSFAKVTISAALMVIALIGSLNIVAGLIWYLIFGAVFLSFWYGLKGELKFKFLIAWPALGFSDKITLWIVK